MPFGWCVSSNTYFVTVNGCTDISLYSVLATPRNCCGATEKGVAEMMGDISASVDEPKATVRAGVGQIWGENL